MTRDDWISAEREFLSYCLEQDEAYVHIPTDPTVSGYSDVKRLTELMAEFARGEKLDDEENREFIELREAEADFDAAPVGDVKTLSLLVGVNSLIEMETHLTIEKLTTILPDIIIHA